MSDFRRTEQPPQPTQCKFQFARSCLPDEVRAHGLRDAHHRPLVGRRYRRRDADADRDRFWSGRVPPDRAWSFPYVEFARTGSSYPALVLDCDDEERLLEGGLMRLPVPSWATWHGDRGCHVVWCLADPVHRYPQASPRPLQALARVEAYYVLAAGADPAFVGVLADNPIRPDTGRETRWGALEPYSLAELAESRSRPAGAVLGPLWARWGATVTFSQGRCAGRGAATI